MHRNIPLKETPAELETRLIVQNVNPTLNDLDIVSLIQTVDPSCYPTWTNFSSRLNQGPEEISKEDNANVSVWKKKEKKYVSLDQYRTLQINLVAFAFA